MAFSVTQAVVSKSILEEAKNSSIDWWSIPAEELVIPRDMLEKFGCYDDVDVNVLMSDKDKENLEPLSKREDRRGSLYCKSLPVCSTVTTITYLSVSTYSLRPSVLCMNFDV